MRQDLTWETYTKVFEVLDELGVVYRTETNTFGASHQHTTYVDQGVGLESLTAIYHPLQTSFHVEFKVDSSFGRLFAPELVPKTREFYGRVYKILPATAGCVGCCFDTSGRMSCGCVLMDRLVREIDRPDSLTSFTKCSGSADFSPCIYQPVPSTEEDEDDSAQT